MSRPDSFQSPYGEIGNTTESHREIRVIRHALLCDGRNGITAGFQSPYGEMGNTTLKFSYRDLMLNRSFSPLTGKWVIRLL